MTTLLQHVAGDCRIVAFDQQLGKGIGSTCTLVTEAFLPVRDAGGPLWTLSGYAIDSSAPVTGSQVLPACRAAAHPIEAIDRGLAILLYGVILLDTLCLSPSAGKATPRDNAAASALCNILSLHELPFDTE